MFLWTALLNTTDIQKDWTYLTFTIGALHFHLWTPLTHPPHCCRSVLNVSSPQGHFQVTWDCLSVLLNTNEVTVTLNFFTWTFLLEVLTWFLNIHKTFSIFPFLSFFSHFVFIAVQEQLSPFPPTTVSSPSHLHCPPLIYSPLALSMCPLYMFLINKTNKWAKHNQTLKLRTNWQ